MTTDDTTAIYILKTIAQARLHPSSAQSHPGYALPQSDLDNKSARAALAAAFGDSHQPASSEGDLARAALDLLAEDPAYVEPVKIMSSQTSATGWPQRYLEPASIALTTAALLALQTRIKFKVDDTGKWSIELDKKSASDSTVKLLVHRLLSFLQK